MTYSIDSRRNVIRNMLATVLRCEEELYTKISGHVTEAFQ